MEKFCIHFQPANGFWLTVQVFLFFVRNKDKIKRFAFFGWCWCCGCCCRYYVSSMFFFAVHVDSNNAVARLPDSHSSWTAKHDKCDANTRASRIHLKNWEHKRQWQFLSLCVNCHLPTMGCGKGCSRRRIVAAKIDAPTTTMTAETSEKIDEKMESVKL